MRKEKYPSKETVNLALCGSVAQHLDRILPVFFVCLMLAGIMVLFCVVWPLKKLNDVRGELSEKKEELRRYQEYNKDYVQTEEDYCQYFAAYLTEEEAALVSRAQVVEQLEERSFAYGKVESMKIQDNICQLVIEDIPVTAMTQLSEELESSAMISQVMVSTAEAREEKAGSDKSQTVTADLTLILAGPDRE